MAEVARLFSTAEAAAVSGVGVKTVNNAIDKRIIKAVKLAAGAKSGARRKLTQEEVLRLKLWYHLGDLLSQDRRRALFEAIRTRPDAKTIKAGELLIVDVEEARRQIATRTRDLEAAEKLVTEDKAVLNGEPVFAGTRVPVRLVAIMLKDGTDAQEILEGYPKLTARHLELAPIWTSAHPQRGRPKSLKARGMTPKSSRRVTLADDPRSR